MNNNEDGEESAGSGDHPPKDDETTNTSGDKNKSLPYLNPWLQLRTLTQILEIDFIKFLLRTNRCDSKVSILRLPPLGPIYSKSAIVLAKAHNLSILTVGYGYNFTLYFCRRHHFRQLFGYDTDAVFFLNTEKCLNDNMKLAMNFNKKRNKYYHESRTTTTANEDLVSNLPRLPKYLQYLHGYVISDIPKYNEALCTKFSYIPEQRPMMDAADDEFIIHPTSHTTTTDDTDSEIQTNEKAVKYLKTEKVSVAIQCNISKHRRKTVQNVNKEKDIKMEKQVASSSKSCKDSTQTCDDPDESLKVKELNKQTEPIIEKSKTRLGGDSLGESSCNTPRTQSRESLQTMSSLPEHTFKGRRRKRKNKNTRKTRHKSDLQNVTATRDVENQNECGENVIDSKSNENKISEDPITNNGGDHSKEIVSPQNVSSGSEKKRRKRERRAKIKEPCQEDENDLGLEKIEVAIPSEDKLVDDKENTSAIVIQHVEAKVHENEIRISIKFLPNIVPTKTSTHVQTQTNDTEEVHVDVNQINETSIVQAEHMEEDCEPTAEIKKSVKEANEDMTREPVAKNTSEVIKVTDRAVQADLCMDVETQTEEDNTSDIIEIEDNVNQFSVTQDTTIEHVDRTLEVDDNINQASVIQDVTIAPDEGNLYEIVKVTDMAVQADPNLDFAIQTEEDTTCKIIEGKYNINQASLTQDDSQIMEVEDNINQARLTKGLTTIVEEGNLYEIVQVTDRAVQADLSLDSEIQTEEVEITEAVQDANLTDLTEVATKVMTEEEINCKIIEDDVDTDINVGEETLTQADEKEIITTTDNSLEISTPVDPVENELTFMELAYYKSCDFIPQPMVLFDLEDTVTDSDPQASVSKISTADEEMDPADEAKRIEIMMSHNYYKLNDESISIAKPYKMLEESPFEIESQNFHIPGIDMYIGGFKPSEDYVGHSWGNPDCYIYTKYSNFVREEIFAQMGTEDVDIYVTEEDYGKYILFENQVLEHVIELYDIEENATTNDILQIFKKSNPNPLYIKWCDSKHCLIVFDCESSAIEALKLTFDNMKTRPAVHSSVIGALAAGHYDLIKASRQRRSRRGH